MSTPDGPEFPPVVSPTANIDVPALLGELAAMRDELRAVQRVQLEDLQRYRAEVAEAREEHAERARAGELGREWSTLQRRIDYGETTVDAVVRGEDASSQAEVVRGFARENAETAAAELDAEVEAAEEGREVSPAAAAFGRNRELVRELQEQLARLQQLRFPTP